MISLDFAFDTRLDTKKMFVPMKTHFAYHNYVDRYGFSQLYLHISSEGRERIPIDVKVIKKYWDKNKQRVSKRHPDQEQINLMLDNIEARITKIKTVYHLSERVLTTEKLIEELKNSTPRSDFIVFFSHYLKKEKSNISYGTYRRNKGVLSKLKKYRNEIMFSDLNYNFIKDYRLHLAKTNKRTTINSNINVIKKYIRAAQRMGIKAPVDLDEIKIGKTVGNRIDLNPVELKKVFNYYTSHEIMDHHKTILGYFLFSCFTGLRWQTVRSLTRSELIGVDYFTCDIKKTGKRQTIPLNSKAKEVVEHCDNLFNYWVSDIYVNRELKKVMQNLNIKKKVSFHVARHTFATNFLRMGGSPAKLQQLLGHSNIRETMIYVHITEQESREEVQLLDALF